MTELGLTERLEAFVKNLPSKELEVKITTPHLKEKFYREKFNVIQTGKLLKAKFGGGGGNPAKEALNAGIITINTYHNMISIANMYASMFDLYQTAWTEIEMIFQQLENSPNTEIELFLESFREEVDENFLRAVNGENFSLKKSSQVSKIIVEVNKRGQKDPNWDFTLNTEEENQLNKFATNKPRKSEFSWKDIALNTCEYAAKNDSSIRKALRHYCNNTFYIINLTGQFCYAETQKNPPELLQSTKWENGIEKVRTAKGFKPVTILNTKRH